MVVGHWTDNHLLITYIYSFHMPALFIISGYLFKPHAWYKSVLSFVIPIIFFSLINLLVQLLIGEITFETIIFPQIFFRIIHYRYGLGESLFIGDWFLYALLGLRFLFGDISSLKVMRKFYIVISVVCVLYMTFESDLVSIETYLSDRNVHVCFFIDTVFDFTCFDFLNCFSNIRIDCTCFWVWH